MRLDRLFVVLCSAALFGNTLTAGARHDSSVDAVRPVAWAPQQAELTGQAGSLARGVNSNLERFEKILASPGTRLKSALRAAEGYLEQAEEDHKKILSRYSSTFDQKSAAWVKLEARLRKAQADGKAFKVRVTTGKAPGGANAKGGAKAAPKLSSLAGYALKKVESSLDDFDKTMARRADFKDKGALFQAAKRDLGSANDQFSQLARDYAGQFDAGHPKVAAVTTRLAKAKTDLQAFYDAKVDGGGTKADGSKVTGYADAQSIVPANNPNRKSIDRIVLDLLRETESIRASYERKDKLPNQMDSVRRSLQNAARKMSRLQQSYGSMINKESVEYLALLNELKQAERRAGEIPAMVAADGKARAHREAEAKRLAELARAQSKAEQEAADKARLEAAIDRVRFPSFKYKNAKLDKVATAVVRAFYKGQKIERLQVREPYEVLREARIKKSVIEFGTYRYLRLAVVLRGSDGVAKLYEVSMRNTQRPDGSWGPLVMYGGQYFDREIRTENIHK